MILWAGKVDRDLSPANVGHVLGWRWVFRATTWGGVVLFAIGFVQQAESAHTSEWYSIRDYSVWFRWRDWLWGFSHIYYDGPHCALHLGPLHISWDPEWCKKCMPRC